MLHDEVDSCKVSLANFFYWLENFMESSLVENRRESVSPFDKSFLITLRAKGEFFSIPLKLKSKGFSKGMFLFNLCSNQCKDKVEMEGDSEFNILIFVLH